MISNSPSVKHMPSSTAARMRNGFLAVRLGLLAPLLIAAAGIAAYANSFSGSLVYDDARVFQKLMEGPRLFGLFPVSSRPVTDATFALNYWLSGIKPADYHALNLCFHIATALILFGLVRRTLGFLTAFAARPSLPTWFAFAVAGLWVCHPLTTSAVTYVAQRYEVLMSMFYVLALYGTARAATSHAPGRWITLAVLACGLGMASKEVLVTAPVAVVLYDWWFPLRGDWREGLRKRWRLYAGVAATWLIAAALMRMERREGDTAVYAWQGVSALQYGETELAAIARYLRLSCWPRDLCFDYSWPVASGVRAVAGPAMLVTVLACLSGLALWRRHAWGFPAVMFFLILLPTSSVVPRPDPVVEHRMYLALAAVLTCAVGVVVALGRALAERCPMHGRWGGIGGAVLAAVMVCLTIGSVARNRVYGSDLALWEDVVLKRPENLRAWMGLGAALLSQGDSAEARKCFAYVLERLDREAVPETSYRRTLAAMAHNNLGVIFFRENQDGPAAQEFRRALQIAPTFREAKGNLTKVAARMGGPSRSTP